MDKSSHINLFVPSESTRSSGWLYCTVEFKEYTTVPSGLVRAFSQLNHTSELIAQFGSLCLNAKFSDVTLCTTLDSKEFPAHRLILSIRSTVFAAMFSHEELKESQNKRVEISDVSGDVMKAFLDYIYSGNITKVEQFSVELLELADKVCLVTILFVVELLDDKTHS